MASTSGTVATYPYTNAKIIEHACRRALIQPQELGAEDLETCLDLLFTVTCEWQNLVFFLWTRQFNLLGCTIGSPDVPTPDGTVEVLHSYWRIFQPYRGACILPSGASDILLFGGQPNDDVTITTAAPTDPFVSVDFTSETEIDTVGVLLGGSEEITTRFKLYISEDGATWELFQTLPSATYSPGQWVYFDLNPTVSTQYLRIVYDTQQQGGTIVLSQLQFALANGQDIENGPLNIDDYYNLPNKQFRSGRPNSVYQDRQVDKPVLKIWPTLNVEGFYNGTISCLSRRNIQDPGRMTDIMEMPTRWFEALTWKLASRVIYEIENPRLRTADGAERAAIMNERRARIPEIKFEAEQSYRYAAAEERNRAPIRLTPNISPYTR